MALYNTINFLPEIFRSSTNQRFLGATMDQLFTDAVNVPLNGYIGRKFDPTYQVNENYIPEHTAERQHYQLEPSVVITDDSKHIKFNAGYIDLLNSINVNNGLTNNHQRLFTETAYNYDGKFNYDKFVNYFNYYWLPSGPVAVVVSTTAVPYTATYNVTRNSAISGYVFSGIGSYPNLPLTLARGGTYTFIVNQLGAKFWIQTEPGLSGVDTNISTVSTRQVVGVTNNGTDSGAITFTVPHANSQDFYSGMPLAATVDVAINTFDFTSIQNRLLSDFVSHYPLGFDGINNQLQNKTLIFINNLSDDTNWQDGNTVVPKAQRTGVWQITLIPTGTGDYTINLIPFITVTPIQKIFVISGNTYASNSFWLDSISQYLLVPINTTTSDYLYYQDSINPNFIGVIKMVDNATSTIDINQDILGQLNYVSPGTSINPGGIVFTNGLKIQFDNSVTPISYAGNEYYVEGVGTGIVLTPVAQLVVPEPFRSTLGIEPVVTATGIIVGNPYTILSRGTTDFTYAGAGSNTVGTTFIATSTGVGTGTVILAVMPGSTAADYITINRASQDLNPWTRSNRWFHKDVINAVATYNVTPADYGPNIAGRRAIIEFDPNLQLFNFGQQSGNNITYIVFAATNAFVDIEGQITYSIDGRTLQNADRIVFANDFDPSIIDSVWEVQHHPINNTEYITLTKTVDSPILAGQNLLVTDGVYTGKTIHYNGSVWSVCQEKFTVNQPPLFDLVDTNGYSFSNSTVYPLSNFAGTKLFGYEIPAVSAGSFVVGSTYTILNAGTTDFTLIGAANNNYKTPFTATGAGTGTGVAASVTGTDVLLGFPLTYQNFNNIGDIVFSNYYDTDTFTYTENQLTTQLNCNVGYIAVNNGINQVTKVNNWVPSIEGTEQFQIFTALYDGRTVSINGINQSVIQIDILPTAQATVPHLKVYQNNKLLKLTIDYTLVMYGVYHLIALTKLPTLNDKIDVAIFSSQASAAAYYEIPCNLDFNPLNQNFNTITLGQLRSHYNKLVENTSFSSTGVIPVRDYYLKQQGGTLLQHQAPVIYAMTFLNDPTVNFTNGVTLAKKEYAKFKNKFLSLCASLTTLDYKNPLSGVDTVLQSINAIKNSTFPWYYSDMVPQDAGFSTITYNIVNARQTQYEITSQFDNTQLSNRAVLVYVNGAQLAVGVEYTFSLVSPAIIFTIPFKVGDVLTIRDYANTDGNYIPETPSKLGLYPKYVPEILVDDTYQTPITVIRGHDGSITPAFGDFRDQYLLELELRIYNNIKADYSRNAIDLDTVIPGRFRTIDYSLPEYNKIMAQNFLAWVGTYKVNYTDNVTYDANNPWTWNYSEFTDVVNGSPLQGFWRSIYQYWFDTDTPHITPWEMVGFSSMPIWWTPRYGPAPYTSGNTLLWSDLQAGYIWNNGTPTVDINFARPGLLKFIPVDSGGNLLPPTQIQIIKQYSTSTANYNFQCGQYGPAETAWKRSSDYPFAIQIVAALTKPAMYFATQLDTSRFYTNPVTGQFSDIHNQKIAPNLLTVNGARTNGVIHRTSGYVNWIADSIKNLGIDPVTTLTQYFTNFSVRLNYKVAGFTDHRMLTVSAEQTTPGITNASIIIPSNNYQIYLNKSVPVATAVYSAVTVQKTNNGYSVVGYDPTNPFFNVLPSIANNNSIPLTLNGTTVQVYQDSTHNVLTVPYGTEFTTVNQTVDFLISYQRYLISVGFVFDQYNTNLNALQDWSLSATELVFWSQQGWATGTIIVLNPTSTRLKLNTIGTIVDEITNAANGNKLLDENFNPIKSNNFNITRMDEPTTTNTFLVSVINGATVAYAKLNLVQYEHVLIFDNVDDFGDIVYVPSQGTRQFRLELRGAKTGAWDGALSAAGYIYSDPNIQKWVAGTDYRLGDLVTYNNFYYTAMQAIPASTTFSTIPWSPVNSNEIKTGLLPSLGLNAQEFVNFYDVDNPPQDSTYLEYSAGLIGFRQRRYLTDLGIGIPTQTKFYQGFIKQKGSMNAITALTKATFNNVSGNINLYEEWAFRVGVYGGVSNVHFREFILDQSVFNIAPVAFTLADTYNTANVIVDLTLANIYNASNISSTVTSIYNNRTDAVYIDDLPSVGYVNINDIDYTQFDITNSALDLTKIGPGSKIWAAKTQSGNWGVYRVSETNLTAVALTHTLDNFAQLTFNNGHLFNVGDLFILKYFNKLYDGVYVVDRVIGSTAVIITLAPAGAAPFRQLIKTLTIPGSGLVYKLTSAQFPTVEAIANVTVAPLNGWIDNDRIWVDTATTSGWGVYTYVHPWVSNTAINITANTITANAYFGQSTRVSSDAATIYVGNPGNSQVQIFANMHGTYSATYTLDNADISFGSAVDTQGNLVTVGAPTVSAVHIYEGTSPVQTLTSANSAGLFGSSMSISANQQWIYVGEPSTGVVQAYWTANVASPSYINIDAFGTFAGQFGHIVKTNSSGNIIVVGAPAANTGVASNGNVYIYQRTGNAFALSQTLTSQHQNSYALFGTGLSIDGTAGNLYIGAPGSTQSGYANGVVERYVLSSGTYAYHETIVHPHKINGEFGLSISVSADSTVLAVGSSGSPSSENTTFDTFTLTIDSNATRFVESVANSGATYLFEPLINQTLTNDFGQYIYTQELESQLYPGAKFGSSVDATRGVIAVGAPGYKYNQGSAYIFTNPTKATAWNLTRTQQSIVDIDSVGRTLIYNKSNNNILAALDFIDPAKGKVLNIVDQDIDYKLTADPALYNASTGTVINDLYWGPAQIGTVWWDIDQVRYINYEQDNLTYRLVNWGMQFPGSQIAVYQWIESAVLPSKYVATGGKGIPLHSDDSAYSTHGFINSANGVLGVKYYFWVQHLTLVAPGKINSVLAIADAIANPYATGIPYATILRNDTVAFYNINNLLVGRNSVVQLASQNTTQNRDASIIHGEYALVQEGNPNSKIPVSVLAKFADSLSGVDQIGNPVPDPALIPSQAYGISVRPRQSMIINQRAAMTNYLAIVNPLLKSYPIIESKVLTILNSGEISPAINSGAYNLTVATYNQLTYVDTTNLLPGYMVLVTSDSTNSSKWAIYTLNATGQFTLTRVQSYLTPLYWSYTDWYVSTYDPTIAPDVIVANNLIFGTLVLRPNTYIKILNNGANNFIVYFIDGNLNKNVVGIQNGTIQISTGTIPPTELRQILIAMQEDILVSDLAIDFNTVFFSMIRYILTEQKNVDWIFKTSFISATQRIRKLQEFPSYVADNQNFYLDYINEVKPYRTTVREFIVDYVGNDQFAGDITDFDLPPYWDANLQVYRSPNGTQPSDTTLWGNPASVYNQWYQHYTYDVVAISVGVAGTGYILPPQVIITGGGGTGAVAIAEINSNGGVSAVYIVATGEGYTSQPTVTFNGTGTGALGYATLRDFYVPTNISNSYNLIRSISTTIKFDRITYTNPTVFVPWNTITTANIGQTMSANSVIVLNATLYKLTTDYTIDGNITFPFDTTTVIAANSFTNASDRIIAFNGNVDLGIALKTEFPGVLVDGNSYVSNNFDTIISSQYTAELGISPSEIDLDGGAYYDIYNSRAPEELIPGRLFDSLNIEMHDTQHMAYRTTTNMSGKPSYYRITSANTTVLSSDLLLTDNTIHVANALALPPANPGLKIPGVVWINGEMITYYRNYAWESQGTWVSNSVFATDSLISALGNVYLVTGNVYGSTFASVLANVELIDTNSVTHLRRGVDGTTPGTTVMTSVSNCIIVHDTLLLTNTSVVTGNLASGMILTGNTIINMWAANTAYPPAGVVLYNSDVWTVSGNIYGATFLAPSVQANVIYNSEIDDWVTTNSIAKGIHIISGSGNTWMLNTTVANGIHANIYGTLSTSTHFANTPVVDSSIQQLMPNVISNTTTITADAIYQACDTATVSYKITLSSPIDSNIGDILEQFDSNGAVRLLGMTSIATLSNTYAIAVNITSGNLTAMGLPNVYDSINGFDAQNIDTGFVIVSTTAPIARPGYILPVWLPNTVLVPEQIIFNSNVYTTPTEAISYSGNVYAVLGNVYGATFSSPSVQANVQYRADLTTEFGGNLTLANLSLQVNDTWVSTSTMTASHWNGAAWVLQPPYQGSGFSLTASSVYVNGVMTPAYITSGFIIGMVDKNGNTTVPSGSTLTTDKSWYDTGYGITTSGTGLYNSTTEQANFLKASLD